MRTAFSLSLFSLNLEFDRFFDFIVFDDSMFKIGELFKFARLKQQLLQTRQALMTKMNTFRFLRLRHMMMRITLRLISCLIYLQIIQDYKA